MGETAAAGGVLMGLGLRGVLEIAAATATAAAGLAETGPLYRETDGQTDVAFQHIRLLICLK